MPRSPGVSGTTESLTSQVYSSLLDRARQRPGPMYPLHVGDTYLEPWPGARGDVLSAAEHPRLYNYAPVQGEPALIQAIGERMRHRHGADRGAACIQVTVGATGGLSVATQALLDPGDEVLLLAPYWPLIRGIVAGRGAEPVEVPFYDRLDQPGFDIERALSSALTPRTAALYVNSPNNPSGRVLGSRELDVLVRFARKHDLWIFADEAYDELSFSEPVEPLWLRAPESCLAFHTASKCFGVAGARVGWIHGPESVMRTLSGVQTFVTYCAPRPLQLGVARALGGAQSWLDDARAKYLKAGQRAAQALGLPAPGGGTFLFFDVTGCPAGHAGVDAFLESAMEAGVLLTPGRACGQAYASWVRLCFSAVPPAELDDAIARLAPLVRQTLNP